MGGVDYFGCDPAVTADGVFVSHSGHHTSRFDRLTGTEIWSVWAGPIGGGGAWTPVVAGGLVDAREDDDVMANIIMPPYILQVSDGADAGTFLSGSPPAVHDGHLFVLSHGIVSSVDSLGQNTAWSFGDGTLVTPPIVASGRVFVGSSSGTLYGLDESTGAKVWSDCVFRPHLGTRSGVTWARIPAALGHGFRSTWAAVPTHLGTDSGALGHGAARG
jgi:outer membrane protein assembly factor BamB